MSNIAKRLGRNVRRARESRGLKAWEIRDRARLTSQRISDVERGRHVPALDLLMRIASAIPCSLDELAADTGDRAFDDTRSIVAADTAARVSDFSKIVELLDPAKWRLLTLLPRIAEADVPALLSIAERLASLTNGTTGSGSGPSPEGAHQAPDTREKPRPPRR